MISRRAFLLSTTGATAMSALRTTSGLAAGSQTITPIHFSVPRDSCDCQTHIFGDPVQFPFWSGRSYTPEPATISEMRALHQALHMDRVVIVQPTVYGTDNACMLDALRQLGSRARGVAMVDEGVPQAYLDEMEGRGVRGLRIGFDASSKTEPSFALRRLRTTIQQIADRKWHIQIGTRLPLIEALYEELSAAPVPIVFEHFAHAEAPLGLDQAGFRSLLNLVKSGRAYVKISAAYRCCSASESKGPDFPEI